LENSRVVTLIGYLHHMGYKFTEKGSLNTINQG